MISEINFRDDTVTVNLITIYDKGDIATITDKELRELIKTFHQQ